MKLLKNLWSLLKLPEAFGLCWIMLSKKLRDRYLEALVAKAENEAKHQDALTYKAKAEGNKANMEALNLLPKNSNNITLDGDIQLEHPANGSGKKLITITETVQVSPPSIKWARFKAKGSDVLKWIQVSVPASNRMITKQIYV